MVSNFRVNSLNLVTTPSAPRKGFAAFFYGAATLPRRGGEWPSSNLMCKTLDSWITVFTCWILILPPAFAQKITLGVVTGLNATDDFNK